MSTLHDTHTEAAIVADGPTGNNGARDWLAVADDVATRIEPHAAAHDREGTFVHEAFAELRASGLVSALVPTDLGGGGASHAEACQILTRLAKGCPATAVTLSMHYHLVATQLWRHRHGQPAEAVLRRVADERLVLVSTGASDWVGSGGTARQVEGGFCVSARKSPASGAPAGDVAVTSIRWDDAPDGPQVIHCSVPFGAPGVAVEETWDAMGLRGTGSHTIVFEDVFVPDAAVSLIRPADVWHPVWSAVLGAALPLIMAAYLGIGESMAAAALDQAKRSASAAERAELAGEMLDSLAIGADAVDTMVRASKDLTFDATVEHASMALTRKAVAARALIDVAQKAVELTGGAGYAVPFGLERLFRDVHGATFHPLPGAKQRRFTGRLALGLDPLG